MDTFRRLEADREFLNDQLNSLRKQIKEEEVIAERATAKLKDLKLRREILSDALFSSNDIFFSIIQNNPTLRQEYILKGFDL